MRRKLNEEKIDLQSSMTPMIDVVFQLLIFFMLTYKPRMMETSFEINLPAPRVTAQAGGGQPDQQLQKEIELEFPDVPVRLLADSKGGLAGIRVGKREVKSLEDLRRNVAVSIQSMKGAGADEVKVEIEPDETLDYEHIVRAIGAITLGGCQRVNLGFPRKPGAE